MGVELCDPGQPVRLERALLVQHCQTEGQLHAAAVPNLRRSARSFSDRPRVRFNVERSCGFLALVRLQSRVDHRRTSA